MKAITSQLTILVLASSLCAADSNGVAAEEISSAPPSPGVCAAAAPNLADRGHINPGGEEIDCDRNLWTGVIAESTDQRPNVVHAACDLFNCRVVNLTVFLRKGFLDGAHYNVGVGIGRGENQRLARKGRIDVVRQFLSDHAIELGGYNLLVELFNLEADFVGRMGKVDFAGPRIQQVQLFVFLKDDWRGPMRSQSARAARDRSGNRQ